LSNIFAETREAPRTNFDFVLTHYDVIMLLELQTFENSFADVLLSELGYRGMKNTPQRPSFKAALHFWCKLGWISFAVDQQPKLPPCAEPLHDASRP
jgi:hypothetical protein